MVDGKGVGAPVGANDGVREGYGVGPVVGTGDGRAEGVADG
jgi:hypothetical protein